MSVVFEDVNWSAFSLVVREYERAGRLIGTARSAEEASALVTPPADLEPGQPWTVYLQWVGSDVDLA